MLLLLMLPSEYIKDQLIKKSMHFDGILKGIVLLRMIFYVETRDSNFSMQIVKHLVKLFFKILFHSFVYETYNGTMSLKYNCSFVIDNDENNK